MRAVGVILLVIGFLLLLVGVSMDVTVATGSGGRVYNIGLMNERSNLFAFGGGSFLVGLILIALGGKKAADIAPATERSTRSCPYCAEQILVQAIKCKHCGSSIETDSTPPLESGWVVRIPCRAGEDFDRVGETIAKTEYQLLSPDGSVQIIGFFADRDQAKAAEKHLSSAYKLHGDVYLPVNQPSRNHYQPESIAEGQSRHLAPEGTPHHRKSSFEPPKKKEGHGGSILIGVSIALIVTVLVLAGLS